MPRPSPLESKLRNAGAVIAERQGDPVALHYGSAAAELAVCMRSVGLVDRPDLRVLAARGDRLALDEVVAAQVGRPLAVGESAAAGGSFWGRLTSREAVLVCPLESAPRLTRQLQAGSFRYAGFEIGERAGEMRAIGIVGRAAPRLLADLGAHGRADGDPGDGHAFATLLGGSAVVWISTGEFALALVEEARLRAAWEAIELAGRRFGISYVGAEAFERFSIASGLRALRAGALA